MTSDYTQDNSGNPAVPSASPYRRTEELPYVLGNDTVREYAREIADSIIEDARTVHGPVVWITGNAYMPPLRSITLAERVYQADNNRDGELFAWLVEMVEDRLRDANVTLECPDYDNALYAVDMNRWRYIGDDDGHDADDLNDDWELKSEDYRDPTDNDDNENYRPTGMG